MHELKTWSNYFLPMATGAKPFDLRYDDGRNFCPGDTLYLREYDRESKLYSGKVLIGKITYVLRLKNFLKGVDPNWKILGIANLKLVYKTDREDIISSYTRELYPIITGERPFCIVYDQEPKIGQTITIVQYGTTKAAVAKISHIRPVNLTDDPTNKQAYIISIRDVVYKG